MKVYNDFEKLPHRRGYGIKSLSYKEEIVNIMNETDWSKVAFPSTNGAYNLRFNIIEKTVWNGLPDTVSLHSSVDIEKFCK